MRLNDRLRFAMLRWNRLGLVLVLALPIIVSSVLGFVWLHERGWLLWFVLGSVALYATVRLGLLVVRWRARRSGTERPRDLAGPEADPDWSESERAAFARARVRIGTRLQAPIPWADLPAEALVVVEDIAADMSGGQRSALDFTVPEALLLIDRVALQYRAFLLNAVPLSDRLSVRTMHWLWRKQDTAQAAWDTGFLAWRGVRLLINPAAGLLREAERLLATGLQDRLTERFRRDAQAILLEEAAQAAIDLYSGRLRVSDTELARFAVTDAVKDRSLVPLADGPLRLVLVGQRGAGKSALVNALLNKEVAEVDAAPTTRRMAAHDWSLEGTLCRVIDTPGLDGTDRVAAAIANQMADADLVIWVHRANRPGRAADVALADRYAARLAAQPERRAPAMVHVATGADVLVPGWPRAENHLTAADHATLDAAMQSIAGLLKVMHVLPVRAEDPDWNMDGLRDAIAASVPEARRVQRNRLRLAGAQPTGVRENALRAGRGLSAAARTVWSRVRR